MASSLLYLFMLANVFCKFDLIPETFAWASSIILSFVFSVVILVYVIIQSNSTKRTKLSNWIAMNWSKLSLYYIVSLICFVSIKTEIIWGFNQLENIISLEWTIFGISITIFLVWNVLISKYLKEKKPKLEPGYCSPIEKLKIIEQRGEFYQNASTVFNSVSLLIINMILLALATGSTYIMGAEVNLINQNLAIISLYFCTNTLIALFMDILEPLKEEKKAILKGAKISSEDVCERNKIVEKRTVLLSMLKEIDSSSAFDEEQKLDIKSKLLIEYFGEPKLDSSISANDVQKSDPE